MCYLEGSGEPTVGQSHLNTSFFKTGNGQSSLVFIFVSIFYYFFKEHLKWKFWVTRSCPGFQRWSFNTFSCQRLEPKFRSPLPPEKRMILLCAAHEGLNVSAERAYSLQAPHKAVCQSASCLTDSQDQNWLGQAQAFQNASLSSKLVWNPGLCATQKCRHS